MTADAERVLEATVSASGEALGSELDAVFALGSLAHGGFDPLVSDVDVALVVRRAHPALGPRIAGIKDRVTGEQPGPLARRLSLFWTDWRGVRHGPGPGERLPAVDRLDLLDNGRLLHGRDERAGAVPPTAQQLIREAAEFACARFDADYLRRAADPDQLLAQGARATTKAVLFPVRFLYTLDTHRIGLNAAAVDWYARRGAHAPLTDAALSWRGTGIDDPAQAAALLGEHLPGLYREFFTAYRQALEPTDPDLARQLTVTAESL